PLAPQTRTMRDYEPCSGGTPRASANLFLLRSSILGLFQRGLVRRIGLERSVGRCRAPPNSRADSSGPCSLFPGAPAALARLAPGCAAALGIPLWTRVARRGLPAGLAGARGAVGGRERAWQGERLPARPRKARALLARAPG